jgi:hypothetical protein
MQNTFFDDDALPQSSVCIDTKGPSEPASDQIRRTARVRIECERTADGCFFFFFFSIPEVNFINILQSVS